MSLSEPPPPSEVGSDSVDPIVPDCVVDLFDDIGSLRQLTDGLIQKLDLTKKQLKGDFVEKTNNLMASMKRVFEDEGHVLESEAGVFLEGAIDNIGVVMEMEATVDKLLENLETCRWHLGKAEDRAGKMFSLDPSEAEKEYEKKQRKSESKMKEKSGTLVLTESAEKEGVVLVESLILMEPVDADDLKPEKEEQKDQYFHFDDWSFGGSSEEEDRDAAKVVFPPDAQGSPPELPAAHSPCGRGKPQEWGKHQQRKVEKNNNNNNNNNSSSKAGGTMRSKSKKPRNRNVMMNSLRRVRKKKKDKRASPLAADIYSRSTISAQRPQAEGPAPLGPPPPEHAGPPGDAPDWKRWQSLSSLERRALLEAKYKTKYSGEEDGPRSETAPLRPRTLIEIEMEQQDDLSAGGVTIVSKASPLANFRSHSVTSGPGEHQRAASARSPVKDILEKSNGATHMQSEQAPPGSARHKPKKKAKGKKVRKSFGGEKKQTSPRARQTKDQEEEEGKDQEEKEEEEYTEKRSSTAELAPDPPKEAGTQTDLRKKTSPRNKKARSPRGFGKKKKSAEKKRKEGTSTTDTKE